MVERGDGAGLAVEPVQAAGSSALAVGSTLTATRRRISLCSHRYTWPMPPEPSVSSTLYLPMVKRCHLPWRNCSAWKYVSRPSRTSRPASLLGSVGSFPCCGELVDVGPEPRLRPRPRFSGRDPAIPGRWRVRASSGPLRASGRVRGRIAIAVLREGPITTRHVQDLVSFCRGIRCSPSPVSVPSFGRNASGPAIDTFNFRLVRLAEVIRRDYGRTHGREEECNRYTEQNIPVGFWGRGGVAWGAGCFSCVSVFFAAAFGGRGRIGRVA